MNNPQYVKVDNKLYKINTDFRVALECNRIAEDTSIGEYERALAIIYKLFGEDGLDCENQNKLLELGMKYLLLGREQNSLKNATIPNRAKIKLSKGEYSYEYFPFRYINYL